MKTINLALTKKIAYTLTSIVLIVVISCKNASEKKANDKLGWAVLKKPLNNKTVDVNNKIVKITASLEFKVFPKRMETYGTIFAAMGNVSDEFLQEVATTYHQMFPQGDGIDIKKQQEVLNTFIQYGSLIPVLSEHHDSASEDTNKGLDEAFMSDKYSVCDVIMTNVERRQAMEVVEHLLHFITDIGLHFVYPEQWSFTEGNSEITKVMNTAIEKGLYNVSSYSDMVADGKEAYQRVIVQEFAYWLISTYWNLQEPYGNIAEQEWKVDNKKQLLEQLPSGYALVKNTVDEIMKAPSKEVLDGFKKYEK
ncbi:hypothetical protein [uncultured Tenacibaculum sp.]|uniref:hypothetical protein n=1 Tax=uncultured Tenacibaculum sp. TaxID=174713 RepID=UPI002633A9A0|nr:hypothetical protein [uncultured Tenacibaculum sp.]